LRSQQVLYTLLTHSLSQRSLVVPEPKADAMEEEGEDEIPTPQELSAEIAGTMICCSPTICQAEGTLKCNECELMVCGLHALIDSERGLCACCHAHMITSLLRLIII